MTITRDVLVDIMRTPDLKDKHAGFVGFEDIHNWTWCYDKLRLGGFNNVYSMQEVQRLYALGIPTETPEEKEVLDGIESTGEVEWKNGDDVDAYGKPYKYVGLDPFNENLCICLANQDDDPQCFSIGILKKPETPQQRKDRERLEAAYELYAHVQDTNNKACCSFYSFGLYERSNPLYTAIIDKTNYRKEKTNGTN